MLFTREQTEQLLRPVNPQRVKTLQGFSHLEQWDVRAMLIRIFGFGGFDVITDQAEIVYADRAAGRDGKERWEVCAQAKVTLRVYNSNNEYGTPYSVYSDVGAHTATHPTRGEAVDQALKSAQSAALKRAAVNLGDQFGLSLYKDGSLAPVVQKVIGFEATPETPKDVSTIETAFGKKADK